MSKYCAEKIAECAKWVEENGLMEYGGASIKSFAEAMDINQDTYHEWMKKPEFSDAIKSAKAKFKNGLETKIVNSLFKAATGYEFEEIQREGTADNLKKIRKTKKYVQPNIGAGIFLLTNIAPERWKNKISNDIRGEVKTGLTFNVKNEEEKERVKELLNGLR